MRLKRIYIEITNVCNLSCPFCAPHHRAPRFMNFSEFQRVLSQVKPYSRYLYLHVKGEPLLHPEFDTFVKYAYDEGFLLNLTTNGTLLQDHLAITKYLRQINLSLHATNNQEIIKVAKKIKDCIVNFRVWNFEENQEAIRLLEQEFQIIIDQVSNFKITENFYVSAQNKFKWPDLNQPKQNESGYCHALKDQLAILVDGTVVPCCLDHQGDIPLGNLFQEELKDILASDKVLAIQNGFKNRICVEELCKKCEFKNRF